jgi:hypothetical protein
VVRRKPRHIARPLLVTRHTSLITSVNFFNLTSSFLRFLQPAKFKNMCCERNGLRSQ